MVLLDRLMSLAYKLDRNCTIFPTRIRLECPHSRDHTNGRDTTASFDINTETGQYYCFGCKRGGGIKKLFRIYGEDMDSSGLDDLPLPAKKEKLRVIGYPKNAYPCYYTFAGKPMWSIPSYITRRNIRKRAIIECGLHYIRTGSLGSGILFPLKSANYSLWGVRFTDNREMRYFYPTHSAINDFLYRLNELETQTVILVEGIFDAMRLWQYGWTNVCPLLSNKIHAGQISDMYMAGIKNATILFDPGSERESRWVKADIENFISVVKIATLKRDDPDQSSKQEIAAALDSAI